MLNLVHGILSLILLSIVVNRGECNYTKLNPVIQRFVSRQSRALLFPQKGTFIATIVNTAGILPGVPRGLGWTFEFESLFPLPDSVDAWKPNKQTKTIDVPKAKQKIDNYYYKNDEYSNGNYFNNNWQNSNQYTNKKPYFWNANEERKFWQIHSPPVWRPQSYYRYPSSYDAQPQIFQRQRRYLYEKLEGVGKLFGLNMKFCILRSICEIKMSYLLPPGVSMIQDIVRILFDTESITNSNDKRRDENYNDDCVETFRQTCPISLLEFFLHGQRIQY